MKKMLPVFVILLIFVGGGSFYGGMKYSASKRAANRNGAANFRSGGTGAGGAAARMGGNARGGFVSGEIISKDDSSLTVKLRDGGSQIVFFSTSTQIMKASVGLMDDLKAGESISVNGSANPDGSVTAQSIQLRPVMSTSSAK